MARMRSLKTKDGSVDEYITSYPKNIQKILLELRNAIHEAAPAANEAICYGIPTFKLNGNLVHFGAYETHISFYPTSSGVRAFAKELKPYDTSKGTIRFPLDKPLPLALVRRIVRFRVKEQS